MQKRDKLFHMQRNSGKNKDRHHFKQVKHLIQSKIRTAYDNYLKDLLGLPVQNADENPSGFIPKKLYSLIKNAMFYKIQYGLVALTMPSYFGDPRESLATAITTLLVSARYLLLPTTTGAHSIQ